jgi:aminobenzoyl-glutamate utilization protein B
MKKTFLLSFFLFPVLTYAQLSVDKQSAIETIEAHEQSLIGLSDQIWAFAETALREHRSAKVLADYAERQGFTVTRGVAGMPSAFVASYGTGRPVIGILGEYDALPGISQKPIPVKEPLEEGAAGHGCGHNLFGPGSLGAAIAIKELIEKGRLKGGPSDFTVRRPKSRWEVRSIWPGTVFLQILMPAWTGIRMRRPRLIPRAPRP